MSSESEFDMVDDLPVIGAGPVRGMVRVDVSGRTHPGLVRSRNEDNFHIVQFGRYLQTVATSLPADPTREEFDQFGYGFCVADGLGGHAAGPDSVPESTIAEMLEEQTSGAACTALVDRALERGGRDNVTVVVAAYSIPAATA